MEEALAGRQTSDHLWVARDRTEWERFMAHDRANPSRRAADRMLLDYLKAQPRGHPLTFAEIGFGNLQDFRRAFKRLHDAGAIQYTGFDLSCDFVRFAREDWPAYDFHQAAFRDLRYHRPFDLTYTRHTFEHAPPDEWRAWLAAFLAATRRLAVIVWFLAPGATEHLTYPGAWNNRYARREVLELIQSKGFRVEIEELTRADHLYRCERLR